MKLYQLVLFCAAQAAWIPLHAQDSPCDTEAQAAVKSLDELPVDVQGFLGREQVGTRGIADIGGKFNRSDVVLDASVPMRRFVSGIATPHCLRLIVEFGGVGYYQKQFEYVRIEQSWMQLKAPAWVRVRPNSPAAGGG